MPQAYGTPQGSPGAPPPLNLVFWYRTQALIQGLRRLVQPTPIPSSTQLRGKDISTLGACRGLQNHGLGCAWVMGCIYFPGAPIDHKLGTKSVKCPPSPGRASTPQGLGGAAPWSRRDETGRRSPRIYPGGVYWGPRRGPPGAPP